jgi:Inorganic pyrophosphatase
MRSGRGRRVRKTEVQAKSDANKFYPATGWTKLSKIMPEGMIFPYDFGFLLDTKGEERDPLDVLLLSDEGTCPGGEVECRLTDVLKSEQTERGQKKRNDPFNRGRNSIGALRKHRRVSAPRACCSETDRNVLRELLEG